MARFTKEKPKTEKPKITPSIDLLEEMENPSPNIKIDSETEEWFNKDTNELQAEIQKEKAELEKQKTGIEKSQQN
jgi:hypothetical protein